MSKHTIKGKACQDFDKLNPAELSLENFSAVETEETYYRRKDIHLSQRTAIALDLLSREGEYGVVTPLAVALGVSRTFMYDLKETARGALELALACGQSGRPPLSSVIEVEKNRY